MKNMNRTALFFGLIFVILSLGMAEGFLGQRSVEELYESAVFEKESEGNLEAAIKLFQEIISRFPESRKVAAKAQLQIGICYEKLGLGEAQKAYQKVIESYPEQTEAVKIAKEKLAFLARIIAEKSTQEFIIRKVWAGPDVNTGGEPSPDGKYLSFTDMSSGDLAIREIATGKSRRITDQGSWENPIGYAEASIWSPDGKRLAYGWYNKDNSFELRVIGLDKSQPRILYQGKDEWVFPVEWSPDEKYILTALVREYYKTSEIGLISVEDGSLRVFETVKQWPRNMAFSPDGSYIVLDQPQQEDSSEHDIFLLSIDGKRKTPVVKHPADDWVLGWVPNSKAILFSSDRTGTLDAWVVAIEEGKPKGDPELVKKEIGQISPMRFTRQGSFFYSLQANTEDIYIATLDLEKNKIIAPPKKVPQRFVGSNYSPVWSSDGKYLAYISERKPRLNGKDSYVLCIRSDKTGKVRELIPKLTSFTRLRWAPDGRSIFVTGSDETVYLGLFQIDIQTGDKSLIAQSERGANIKDFALSLDGKFVFYAYFEWPKKLARILAQNLETGQVKEVYRQVAPPDLGQLNVSPDGKYLSFTTAVKDPIIKVIPIAGGEVRDLLTIKSGNFLPHAWTPDGKDIIFVKSEKQKCELWRIPVEGGEPQKVDLTMERMRRLRIHPDGSRIVFIAGKSITEIWVMENFLPLIKKQ